MSTVVGTRTFGGRRRVGADQRLLHSATLALNGSRSQCSKGQRPGLGFQADPLSSSSTSSLSSSSPSSSSSGSLSSSPKPSPAASSSSSSGFSMLRWVLFNDYSLHRHRRVVGKSVFGIRCGGGIFMVGRCGDRVVGLSERALGYVGCLMQVRERLMLRGHLGRHRLYAVSLE